VLVCFVCFVGYTHITEKKRSTFTYLWGRCRTTGVQFARWRDCRNGTDAGCEAVDVSWVQRELVE